MFRVKLLTLILIALLCAQAITANDSLKVQYYYGGFATVGSSELAPHYLMSRHEGLVTQSKGFTVLGGVLHEMDTTRRLSWGAGVCVAAGVSSAAAYQRWDDGQWTENRQRPAALHVPRAYVEGKWRGVTMSLGIYPLNGEVTGELSSGDLVMSGNAPAPLGIRAGFVNYQNVPFTRGWVRIKGECGYYRLGDNSWMNNHYNRFNKFVTTDFWFNYKNIYFSTPSNRRVVGVVGAQAACMFGGTKKSYYNGELVNTATMPSGVKEFFKAIIPGHGDSSTGDVYVEGSHLGSWDISLEVKATQSHSVRAYTQWLWEDGSGIGKLNGWDGLWGVEYRRTDGAKAVVQKAVVELLSLTNQSGAVHFNPGDYPETQMTGHATGADNYYNNYFFNGYMSHGLSIGSPMLPAPIYNSDGYLCFVDNWLRGVHFAVAGSLSREWNYTAQASWREAWGTPYNPRTKRVTETSWMLGVDYNPSWKPKLSFKFAVAGDHGTMVGNRVGAMLSAVYSGNFFIKRL